jgi:hypothetical protein
MDSDHVRESVRCRSESHTKIIGIAIDEEINSLMKNFEADQKRLRGIMVNFEEKKPDMSEGEKRERTDLIQMTKDCFNLFKLAYNEQTARLEKAGGNYIIDQTQVSIPDTSIISKDNNSNRFGATHLQNIKGGFHKENNET